jgi:hypothetical protein
LHESLDHVKQRPWMVLEHFDIRQQTCHYRNPAFFSARILASSRFRSLSGRLTRTG